MALTHWKGHDLRSRYLISNLDEFLAQTSSSTEKGTSKEASSANKRQSIALQTREMEIDEERESESEDEEGSEDETLSRLQSVPRPSFLYLKNRNHVQQAFRSQFRCRLSAVISAIPSDQIWKTFKLSVGDCILHHDSGSRTPVWILAIHRSASHKQTHDFLFHQ